MAIRILLIEPQRLFREAFRALLRTQPDFDVVADGGNSMAAISLAAASSAHVTLIDSSVLVQLEAAQLATLPRIVALEPVPPGRSLLHMVPQPLSGIVCKDDPSDEAFTAIRTIAAGGSYVTPRLQNGAHGAKHDGDAFLRSLTAREREILDLVLRGNNTAAVARQLSLSPRTVETHRAHVMRKLGVHSAVDLVRTAARHGLLPS